MDPGYFSYLDTVDMNYYHFRRLIPRLIRDTEVTINKTSLYVNIIANLNTLNVFINTIILFINTIIIIVFVLIGGVIPLLERKYLSLIQRRIGPKYVGYNGRLQFIADAMKLLLKEIILLNNTNKFIMIILPIITLSINLIFLLNIVFLNNIKIIDNNFFIFTLLLVELITVVFLTYIGFLVKNKYTLLASVRLINGVVVFELFLTIIYIYIYILYNKINFLGILQQNQFITKSVVMITLSPLIFNFVLILLKKVPYDIIEAETELIMGYSVEHSGFLSGALLLIEYTHMFF